MSDNFASQGGKPITSDLAIELRQLTFGTAGVPVRCEWVQTPFVFSPSKEDQSYGLKSPRNATRGLLSVVQGFIIKNLLFKRSIHRGVTSVLAANLLRPSEEAQTNALLYSMVEILNQISGMGTATIVLPGEEAFIPHSTNYFQDSVTEKLYVFQLEPNGPLEAFLRRNLRFFTGEGAPGALLFLYSAVLTRSLGKIRSDLDNRSSGIASVVGNMEEGSLTIVTLLLTGRATPYIHNGVIHVGDEDNYAIPQYGILGRCTIGLLLWENDNSQVRNRLPTEQQLIIPFQASIRQPGSRLKTPLLPIWITCCASHFGVMFNTNQDLLRNYHAESRFDLVYYSCSGHQVKMTIDNRSTEESFSLSGERHQLEFVSSASGNTSTEVKEDSVNSPLQRLIHTKWEEANITFHAQSSVLRYLFSIGV